MVARGRLTSQEVDLLCEMLAPIVLPGGLVADSKYVHAIEAVAHSGI
jgi:hypothetical protein